MGPRIRRPSQMIARRKLRGLDCIMGDEKFDGVRLNDSKSAEPAGCPSRFGVNGRYQSRSFLGQELIEELFEDFPVHYAGVGEGLAIAVKDRGGRLVDAIGVAEGLVFGDGCVEGAGLDQGPDL